MNPADPSRRALIGGLAAALLLARPMAWGAPDSASDPTTTALAALEQSAGGRLGAYLLDTGSGRSVGRNQDQRFGMCSTFKLLLAAAVLREVDAGRLALETFIPYTKADMVPHAPVTGEHLAEGGMSIGALAKATQTTSDNVAANLLIAQLGGPSAVTTMLRAMGDELTRLDRIEPDMNLVPTGEVRDTTTPQAMAHTVARIMTGDLLQPDSRELLRSWMLATSTGLHRIRAGLPPAWLAGDKTGTGVHPSMHNKYNDVAVIWPPDRAPVVVAVYFEASGYFESTRPQDEAVLAEVGRIAAEWIRADKAA